VQPFAYRKASGTTDAVGDAATANRAERQFIAGGTNMTDYMRLGVVRPEVLIDINPLAAGRAGRIEAKEDGLWLGALVRMAEAEDDEEIRRGYPVVRDTLVLAASRQIRNMASLGGNVLQRTRCEYFRETSWPCNKRDPGSGCAALEGHNRMHAVLGTSDACIATYPGDFAQALMALDAEVEVLGPDGRRRIPFASLHRLPKDAPQIETSLEPGELILGYALPAIPAARRSRYVKVRDRDSYQFAVAAAAVALDLEGTTVRDVRLALGGLATVPWRARRAEAALIGQALTEASARAAAEAALADARPRRHNAFKLELGRRTIVRALLEAQAMEL